MNEISFTETYIEHVPIKTYTGRKNVPVRILEIKSHRGIKNLL